ALQMRVAGPGDVAVIINFAGLIAAGRQSQPRADRPRLFEVRRVLDGGRERGCGDRTNPGDRHQQLTGLALPCAGDELSPKLSGAGPHAAQGGKARRDDTARRVLAGKPVPDLSFELATFASRNDQPERL